MVFINGEDEVEDDVDVKEVDAVVEFAEILQNVKIAQSIHSLNWFQISYTLYETKIT